jgi:hypothetical protein
MAPEDEVLMAHASLRPPLGVAFLGSGVPQPATAVSTGLPALLRRRYVFELAQAKSFTDSRHDHDRQSVLGR